MRKRTLDSATLLELFVERRSFYVLAEARRLAQISQRRLSEALQEGTVESVIQDGAVGLSWYDVVLLAVTQWTPRRIAAITRRAGHADVLPPLNQHRRITVELPVYQIRLLHLLADRRSLADAPPLTVSDILEYELSELAYVEHPRLTEQAIPGLTGAIHYPSLESWSHARDAIGCLFCGSGVLAPGEVCPNCTRRHVPTE